MPYTYPRTQLPPRKVVPDLIPATIDSGRKTPAAESFSSLDISYWRIDLMDIPLAAASQKIAWRALSLNLEGRLGIANVPIFETNLAPWPLSPDGIPMLPYICNFSDLTIFSDGTDFDDATINANISVNALKGATQVTITLSDDPRLPQPLGPGMDFSVIGTSLTRLYRIKEIISNTDDTVFVVSIAPPLRENIYSGRYADFMDPRCSCRLVDDQQMMSGADDYAGRTIASLSFEEVINA